MNDLSLWLTVLLAALISLFAIYFAVSPLLQPGRASLVLDDDKLVGLLGRKDAILQAIKDLEFDYRVGKISEEDYQRLDQRLRRQAIGLMQQIEKLAPASASLDEQLEGIIAQFRQTSGLSVPSASTPTNGDTPVSASAPAESHSTRFCTHCGKPVEAGHNFCAYCGTPVAQPDAAPSV
ncbi:MAG: zinc-ribbon domain-containing protein [Caldilineaceae bacterium]|nr:zinc-ribbon domain-containing protein [Caldilineaceae bacterium]